MTIKYFTQEVKNNLAISRKHASEIGKSEQLDSLLDRLSNFCKDENEITKSICVLSYDHAEYSFIFTILTQNVDKYGDYSADFNKMVICGGLVYSQLDKEWGLHT